MEKKFTVNGMSCAACSARVEKCVSALNGVKNVSVNLLSSSMRVEFDENILNISDIINEVTKNGYPTEIFKRDGLNKEFDEMKNIKHRFLLSLLFFVPLMYIAMFHMFPHPHFLEKLSETMLYGVIQLLLVAPIIIINRNYYRDGFLSLLRLSPNMNSLIATGSGVTVIYGVYCVFMGDNNLYIESAGMILTLITLGKYLEAKAKFKTKNAVINLQKLSPKKALVERNGTEVLVPAEQIVKGDIIILKNGYSVPADGVVTEGDIIVDQSVITGESIPVEKKSGDSVIAATTVLDGHCKVMVEKSGDETVFSKIIEIVENAMSTKAPIAKLADKISGYFVPFVIVVALVTFAVWKLVGADLAFSVSAAVSVLVISCPCALGLATPVSVTVGMGRGASLGILVKNAESLEVAYKTNVVFFDKTGTVTEGKPYVTKIVSYIDENEFLKIISSLEKMSGHILSEAIIKKYNSDDFYEVDNFETQNGVGVKGVINGKLYIAGNKKIASNCHNYMDVDEIGTQVYLIENNDIIGYVILNDVIKSNSYNAIRNLKMQGIKCIMLTGDNERIAGDVGNKLELDETYAELMPDKKMEIIKKYQSKGYTVAMIGDGVNDAPALTVADIGLAIGKGTDVAVDCADVVLKRNDLEDVCKMFALSKATIKNVKQNLFWAFFYNVLCIPLAAGVFYNSMGLLLNPMIASGAMMFSSLFVLMNALRLNLVKLDKKLF